MGFPGGAVVESPLADAGDVGSCPGPGRSHMPRNGWASGLWPLSLRVRSLCSATGEATTVRGPRTAKRKNKTSPPQQYREVSFAWEESFKTLGERSISPPENQCSAWADRLLTVRIKYLRYVFLHRLLTIKEWMKVYSLLVISFDCRSEQGSWVYWQSQGSLISGS